MPGNEPNMQLNRARRHSLGLAAATSARIAAMGTLAAAAMFPSSTEARGRKWWKHDGKPHSQPGGKSHGQSGGNGQSGGSPMCFLRGTAILTPTGEVCIEDLQIGDRVETVRGEALAVKWIGRHLYKRSGSSWNDSVVPIRISRHALDHQTPHRDLYLSAGHALFIDGVLIRVKDLVNGISIAPALPENQEMIEYFHIVLDTHEVVLAEGLAAETFLLQSYNHEDFTNFVEFVRLYPADQTTVMTPFAPIVGLDSGREHLKALLPQGVRRAFQMRELIHDIYERIATRARQQIR
ncbi:Hint domain-containing protein [Pararhizobium sp. LjRoot255]|uniref:Hint domain-containing protein n=1 Tax=Pararhizobium sp. LjRoot255 TaxID=3342298 RepID=UPI003ECDD4EB